MKGPLWTSLSAFLLILAFSERPAQGSPSLTKDTSDEVDTATEKMVDAKVSGKCATVKCQKAPTDEHKKNCKAQMSTVSACCPVWSCDVELGSDGRPMSQDFQSRMQPPPGNQFGPGAPVMGPGMPGMGPLMGPGMVMQGNPGQSSGYSTSYSSSSSYSTST